MAMQRSKDWPAALGQPQKRETTMSSFTDVTNISFRNETDGLGEVTVSSEKL